MFLLTWSLRRSLALAHQAYIATTMSLQELFLYSKRRETLQAPVSVAQL